jgi:hypothetical protein
MAGIPEKRSRRGDLKGFVTSQDTVVVFGHVNSAP